MKRTPRVAKTLAVLLGASLVAVACGDNKSSSSSTTAGGSTSSAAATTTPSTTVKQGGTVNYAQEEEGTKYNNSTSDASNFSNTVVDNLLQPGPFILDDTLSYNLWPDMMDSASVTATSPNQVVTYKVKAGAVWEDGKPIDCKDFYLAWMAQNGKVVQTDASGQPKKDKDGNTLTWFLPASTTGYEQISKVECSADGKTITTTYNSPFADWKGLFGNLVPAHILEAATSVADITKVDGLKDSPELEKAADFWNNKWANWDKSVSLSGAWFTIKSYTAGTGIVLEKNSKFFGTPANIDSVVFKTVNDAKAQAQALQNGELQVIQPQADPAVADSLKSASGVKYAPQAGLTFEHLDFNFKNPVLADKAVRQAFALCVDREDLITKLVAAVNPDEKPMNSLLFVPQQKGYTDHLGDFAKQDIAKAKSLLEGAGWVRGSDGVYAKGTQKLTFRISHKGIARRSQTTQLIIESCKQAGFAITEDSDKTFNAVRLPKGDYDVALFAWVGTPLLSSTTSIYTVGGGQNWQGYNNPALTDMYKQANQEFDDAKRITEMQAIDKAILDDMASLPLFQLPETLAYSDKLNNVKFNGPLGVTWNANQWFFS